MAAITDTQKKILDTLKKEDRPLTPKEICELTGVKSNTVKHYLLSLVAKGLVTKPFYGHYVTIHGEGMGLESVIRRVHNLKVVVEVVDGVVLPERIADVVVDDVRVVFQCFVGRGVVVGHVGCKDGFVGARGVMLSVELFRRGIELATGWLPPRKCLGFKSAEFIFDHENVRVEPRFCITLRAFEGELLRVYQHGSALREEIKCRPRSFQSLLSFFTGRADSYVIQSRMGLMEAEIQRLTKSQKYSNLLLVDLIRVLKGRER